MNGADWLIMTGCSADLCTAKQWGTTLGLNNSMYIWVDEYMSQFITRQIDSAKIASFTGCSLYTTDLVTGNTWTIGSMGGGGWEKITEFNTGDPRYVGFAVVSYLGVPEGIENTKNAAGGRTDYVESWHTSPQQIYIGIKNYKEDGTPLSAADASGNAPGTYLARNGLAYGRCYGFAVTPAEAALRGFTDVSGYYYKGFEAFFANAARRNGDSIDGAFLPTPWRWNGTVEPVWKTNLYEWQDRPVSGFPGDASGSGSIVTSTTHRFMNATPAGGSGGDNKAEHSSADPRGGQRFIVALNASNPTSGFIPMYDMTGLTAVLNGLADGKLPNSVTCSLKLVVQYGSIDNYTIFTGGGAKNKLGFYSGANQSRRTESSTNADEQNKVPYIVDTLQWYVTSDPSGSDWMYLGEDSSTVDAEACWLAKFYPNNLVGSDVPTYFMSQLSGCRNTSKAYQTIPPRCNYNVNVGVFSTKDNSTEISGSWDLTGLLVKNLDGSFKAQPGDRIRTFDDDVSINNKLIMLGTQHHMSSGGPIATKGLGEGGQLIMLKPKNLPTA
jgi:hypothetical protein